MDLFKFGFGSCQRLIETWFFVFKVTSAAAVFTLSGCAQLLPTGVSRPGLIEVINRPAEKALLAGMAAYDEAHYEDAEKQLNLALQTGLGAIKDQAAAHKYLAFIYCTSYRVNKCEMAFRAARRADSNFVLSKAEEGHPLWGLVYKRLKADSSFNTGR